MKMLQLQTEPNEYFIIKFSLYELMVISAMFQEVVLALHNVDYAGLFRTNEATMNIFYEQISNLYLTYRDIYPLSRPLEDKQALLPGNLKQPFKKTTITDNYSLVTLTRQELDLIDKCLNLEEAIPENFNSVFSKIDFDTLKDSLRGINHILINADPIVKKKKEEIARKHLEGVRERARLRKAMKAQGEKI